MKIYLASTAPGKRERVLIIKRRLLSFYHINLKLLEAEIVFERIKKGK